jgi:sRNA-binding protein
MHLEGPWLSTTGKKKSKQKFRNAEQARKAREQAESWEALLKRHGVAQEEKKRTRALAADTYKAPAPYRRETEYIPSKNPTDMTPCTKSPEKVYTGTNILGIATMHKSNAVPVFSADDAKDISKMRR